MICLIRPESCLISVKRLTKLTTRWRVVKPTVLYGCNLHLKLAARVVYQAVAHDDVHAALAVVCE